MNERLLTARELGEQLGFAPGTIVDWAEAGKIPAFKVGGRLRFRASEVEAWLEERRVFHPADPRPRRSQRFSPKSTSAARARFFEMRLPDPLARHSREKVRETQ